MRKRCAAEQGSPALRQTDAGTPVEEICRGWCLRATFYRKKKFAGMG